MSYKKIISEFIQLQSVYHRTYFVLQEKNKENEQLKTQIEKLREDYSNLQKENENLKQMRQVNNQAESELKRENKGLLAKIKQLQRDSLSKNISKMDPSTPVPKLKPSLSVKQNKTPASHSKLNRTPKLTKKRTKKQLEDYEVEGLIRHRKWRRKYKFLVRWKNCLEDDDRWVDEKDLNCPSLLKDYKRTHQM